MSEGANIAPAKVSPTKFTLSDFVEQHYKLVTCMAAFIALTAFSLQLPDTEAKTTLAGSALFAAGILAMELFFKSPFVDQHWRLGLFQLALLGLFIDIFRYFFAHFTPVWGPFAGIGAVTIFFVAPSLLITTIAGWILKKHTAMSERVRHNVKGGIFCASGFVFFVLIEIFLGGHSITIHIPKIISDLF